MDHEFLFLLWTSAGMGFAHTLLGPDHYLPFIALAKVRHWPLRKTILVTALGGLGHVLSAAAVATLGGIFSSSLKHITLLDSVRGELAAWALIALGLIYLVRAGKRYGQIRTSAKQGHDLTQVPENRVSAIQVFLWMVFILGPCEPLLPLMTYPPVVPNPWLLCGVLTVFGCATLATMLACVVMGMCFTRQPLFQRMGRYADFMAGVTLLLCGAGVKFLGL